MEFTPTAICKWCGGQIMVVDGLWVDETITHSIATPAFAAMCGEGSECHEPESN